MRDLLPAHGKTPSRVQEASRVGGERASNGEGNGHLAQSVDGAVQHDADQGKAYQERSRPTGRKGLARANEETST